MFCGFLIKFIELYAWTYNISTKNVINNKRLKKESTVRHFTTLAQKKNSTNFVKNSLKLAKHTICQTVVAELVRASHNTQPMLKVEDLNPGIAILFEW